MFPLLIQSLLGILPLGAANFMSVYPVLPEWLPQITLRNLRVGEGRTTIRFRRKANGSATFDVLEKKGPLHVVAQPPIESITAGIWDRLGALVKDLKAA